jgi:hypothetical protein
MSYARDARIIEVQQENRKATMTKSVEAAVRSALRPGDILATPTSQATFEIGEFSSRGLALLLGPARTRTLLPWPCLEGIPDFLRNHGKTLVGANRDVGSTYGLDGYLKRWIKRQTANYVAVVLERAGIGELDNERPMHISLAANWLTTTQPS